MSYKELDFWAPTFAVLVSVLFVNYFIPIKGRSDHALATTVGSAVVLGVCGLAMHMELIFVRIAFLMIAVFIADFISTFISFTNRIRNAIVTVIVFTLLYFGELIGLYVLLYWLAH